MLDRCRMLCSYLSRPSVRPVHSARVLFLVCLIVVTGCGALGSGFVQLIDPAGSSGLAGLDNAPGHVVLTFVNNAVVDERLLSYLESAEGGSLVLTDTEKRSLRPLIRMRVQVNFVGAAQEPISVQHEFVAGTALVEEGFAAQSAAALDVLTLENVVHLCDVLSVELDPGSDIEVFMPVELTGYELIETTNTAGDVVGIVFEARERTAPEFRSIEVDDVDDSNRIVLSRNIDPRDVPSPVNNPRCGSVIAITVDGVLSVPFLAGVSDAPSFDREDNQTIAGIGGRFRFRVSVQ